MFHILMSGPVSDRLTAFASVLSGAGFSVSREPSALPFSA